MESVPMSIIIGIEGKKVELRIFASYPIGNLTTGGFWANGNAVGVLTSVPGFIPAINATSIHMDDTFVRYPGAPYIQDTRGLVMTDDGQIIGVNMQGLVSATPHVHDIMANKTGVEPLRWGEMDTFTVWNFQAAAGKYSQLAEGTFVANTRLIPSDNEDTVVYMDYQISQVDAGPLCVDS
ncbi:uncharacterized protein BCR38DRAFT_410245 [Pseudomassariella vexata]|uniref:Uncharacterized protein n=1 Tax=Pseudomassariella vexata TaxID=1141098 RepID=A0A1Y2DXF6_9PEZI|nr:uncharacterized protein BCR38DRAFT_410245 [Pseudomassariella vexata]ORY63305.1 hypothetical protein BCR38DRAFT_410245 [Pseudomassariella vexata]